MAKEIKEAKLQDLIPDDKNLNKGTEYGSHLMEKSFRQFGAGRSILLDKNNRVIAGNKSLQTFAEVGMEKVRIIETTGDELIAVKRVDVDLDSKQGREMALADNATSKANLDWDQDMINEIKEEYELDTEDWGVYSDEEADLSGLFEDVPQKNKSDDINLTIEIPMSYEDNVEDIKSAIMTILEEWKGCKIK